MRFDNQITKPVDTYITTTHMYMYILVGSLVCSEISRALFTGINCLTCEQFHEQEEFDAW